MAPISLSLFASDFNPRLPGGRRHAEVFRTTGSPLISIHASRVGGDVSFRWTRFAFVTISIHASRVGGD